MYKYNEIIERAIVTWIKTELSLTYVFSEKQKLKAVPPTGEMFCTFNLGAASKMGYDDMSYNPTTEKYGFDGIRKIPLSVTIYGDYALEKASILRNSLEKMSTLDTLRVAGIHIARAFDILDTSAVLETGFETRATLDIAIYTKESIIDDTGWIEEVEVTKI